MGIELVEGQDLEVDDDVVWMRTTEGRVRVDVIYRRIDDDFLDPLVFNPDSMLGVPGLVAAYLAGNVALVNAPGTGIADDKAIYSYMPEIVRYYTGEDAKLQNVETWRCREPEALKYTLDHLGELVVKLVDGSGGYGMLVGPAATKAQLAEFRAALIAEPHRYIAQPTLALSTVPTFTEAGIARRHVDFRPFVLTGAKGITIVAGGLTRVQIFITVARQFRIPARYISGHFHRRDSTQVQEAAHAWAEAWVEDLGWVAFDPTHGLSKDENYVRVACGLDYREASPISGARLGGGDERLSVEVLVNGQPEMQVQN
jgi:hypothetical protein